MNLYPIINDILFERNSVKSINCPICNQNVKILDCHSESNHSLYFNYDIIDFFLEKYTYLISFQSSYFVVTFYDDYNSNLFYDEKFEYDILKDFELSTIKEFVNKIKKNLVFL